MADEQDQTVEQGAAESPTVALLRERFSDAILDVSERLGETTIIVRPDTSVEVCRALRDDPTLQYNVLSTITAVDWLEREPRYDVVYHLMSLSSGAVVRLKIQVGDDEQPQPEAPSVISVWPAANWYEREVFDLFGIRFAGHPDLRRIEMPDDWVGHPLRKDYPLTGIQLPEPHWGGQLPFAEPLPAEIGQQTLRAPGRVGDVASGTSPDAADALE
jgi:NADH-quinone oxidoreductase subunit C